LAKEAQKEKEDLIRYESFSVIFADRFYSFFLLLIVIMNN